MMSNPNEPQKEALPTVKKGSVSAAISRAVAEVFASHFMKVITSVALGGITSTSEMQSAAEVETAVAMEASDPAQSSNVHGFHADASMTAHPQTCGRQVQAGMHAYERD